MVFKRTGFIQSRELLRQRSATESRRDDTLSPHCAVPAGLCSVFVMLAFP